MIISFNITNQTSSNVDLKLDNEIVQSQFVLKDETVSYSLTDEQIKNANSITLENSDAIFDITESCKSQIENYVKPVYVMDLTCNKISASLKEAPISKTDTKVSESKSFRGK